MANEISATTRSVSRRPELRPQPVLGGTPEVAAVATADRAEISRQSGPHQDFQQAALYETQRARAASLPAQIEAAEQAGRDGDLLGLRREQPQLSESLATMQGGAWLDYTELRNGFEQAYSGVAQVAEHAEEVYGRYGPFLDESQRQRLNEFAEDRILEQRPPLERSADLLANQLDNPLLQATLRDWPQEAQVEFFEDLPRFLSVAEGGQERLAEFAEGLQGGNGNPYSQAALDLRGQLDEDQLSRFDLSLGASSALGGVTPANPLSPAFTDGFEQALQMRPSSDPAAMVSQGFGPFAAAGAGTTSLEFGLRALSEEPGHFSEALGRAAPVFGVLDSIQRGDPVAAGLSGAEVLTGAGAFGSQAAKRLAPVIGWAATAYDVYDWVAQESPREQYQSFVEESLPYAMGEDPLLPMVRRAGEVNSNLLFPADQEVSPRQQLISTLEDLSPNWQTDPVIDMSFGQWLMRSGQ